MEGLKNLVSRLGARYLQGGVVDIRLQDGEVWMK